LAYHGCDQKIGELALAVDLDLIQSDRDYDLGPGIYFWEGDPVYPGSGFYKRTHTQIAVRSLDCIKGIFKPRP